MRRLKIPQNMNLSLAARNFERREFYLRTFSPLLQLPVLSETFIFYIFFFMKHKMVLTSDHTQKSWIRPELLQDAELLNDSVLLYCETRARCWGRSGFLGPGTISAFKTTSFMYLAQNTHAPHPTRSNQKHTMWPQLFIPRLRPRLLLFTIHS